VVGPDDDVAAGAETGRDWVAPEAGADPTAFAAPAPVPVAPPDADAGIRLPVPLRPMTMGDLLDGGFNVLRADFRTVMALAAVFVVPVQLLVAFLNRDVLADLEQLVDETLAGTGTSATTTVGSGAATLIATVGGSLGQTLIAAGLALMVIAWYSGERLDLGGILRALRPRLPALAVAWLFVHLLELAGAFAFGLGALVAMTFYLVTAPLVAIEATGPFAGMGRASRLAGRRFWFLLGFALLSGLVASTLGQILGLLPQLLGLVLGPDLGWIALGVGTIVAELVATTVVGASTALAYLDLRIRQEGLDLAWAAETHLPQ
jgi:hypothetical protein